MTQRVLITGGADGIGFGIAQRFIDEGAKVYICDVREDALAKSRILLPLAGVSCADISVPSDVQRLFDEITETAGGIDILVNNVGIAGPHAAVEKIDDRDWEKTIDVNLNGMFYCIRQAVPGMKQRRTGVIINISSVGSFTLPPNRSVYNTSKWAVEGLTKSLARELGPFNIRCNAILPGIMNNGRMRRIMKHRADCEGRTIEEIEAEYLAFIPMGSMIEPQEIGDLAVFLASDRARHVTSQSIAVCGGLLFEN
jgi:NAD(P)-dependent dehydrogenase (short-subunit alcohol dehydrogenase family)